MESEHLRRRIVLRSYFDRSTIVVRSKKSYDRKRSYYDRRQPVFF